MNHPLKIRKEMPPAADPLSLRDSHSRQMARIALYARLFMSDGLAILIGFSIGRMVRENEWLSMAGIDLMWILYPLYPAIAIAIGTYSIDALASYSGSIRKALRAMMGSFMVLFAIFFLTQEGDDISRLGIGVIFASIMLAMVVLRYLAYVWVNRALGGVLIDELLILDGVAKPAVAPRYLIDAAANDLVPDLDDPAMLERFSQVARFYDRIIVACPEERQSDWATLLKTVDARGEIMIGERSNIGVIGLGSIGKYSTLMVSRGQLSVTDRVQKRLFDLALALPAVIFLAPLLLTVAILIKLDSPGPVLFRQLRVGKNNVPFRIYKFRSMRQEACDAQGNQSTQRDDARISRFGAFIRSTSIDELPQLFNVLKGDMSIVGPRPHAFGSTAETQLFWEITRKYWERHSLKPGITGLAQIRGFRGATDTRRDLLDRLQSDLEYLEDWSVWKDFAIVIATAKVLIHPKAY